MNRIGREEGDRNKVVALFGRRAYGHYTALALERMQATVDELAERLVSRLKRFLFPL